MKVEPYILLKESQKPSTIKYGMMNTKGMHPMLRQFEKIVKKPLNSTPYLVIQAAE